MHFNRSKIESLISPLSSNMTQNQSSKEPSLLLKSKKARCNFFFESRFFEPLLRTTCDLSLLPYTFRISNKFSQNTVYQYIIHEINFRKSKINMAHSTASNVSTLSDGPYGRPFPKKNDKRRLFLLTGLANPR